MCINHQLSDHQPYLTVFSVFKVDIPTSWSARPPMRTIIDQDIVIILCFKMISFREFK